MFPYSADVRGSYNDDVLERRSHDLDVYWKMMKKWSETCLDIYLIVAFRS